MQLLHVLIAVLQPCSHTHSYVPHSVYFHHAAVQEIITEPASQTVAVHQPTQFKCTAYVAAEISGLTLTWTDTNTGLAVGGEDGFRSSHEVFEANDIILVTSVLSFFGGNESTSYSLSCTTSALDVNTTSDFTLSVIPGTGATAYDAYLMYLMYDSLACYLSPTANIGTNEETEVDVEATLSLTCNATGSPYPGAIFWVRDGKVLRSDSRVTVTTRNGGVYFESELNVSSIELADGGIYSCIVNSGVEGAIASAEINVTVRDGM